MMHMGHSSANAHPTDSAADQPRVRLLLVEDDPDQQDLIAEVLEEQFGAGCVEVVGRCQDADAVADPTVYDLILLDINLPDGNGLDVLERLRGRCGEVPVMMLTGASEAELAREAIRRGAVDYVVKAGAYLATMPLTVEKNLAAGDEARRRQDEVKQVRVRLSEAEREASTDAMTGCYNRRAFERIFEQSFAESYRGDGDLACVMIDLDKFKQVNDTLGHAVGDDLIKAAARSILSNLRQMDVACRLGGDEFVLLLPRTNEQSAAQVADRIREDYATASSRLLPARERKTMSIGVASVFGTSPRPSNPEALMLACDQTLYRAKESGRDATLTSNVLVAA